MTNSSKKDKSDQPDSKSNPYQQFEDLARKIVGVPKDEIDRKEQEYQQRKKRREAKTKK